MREIKFRGKRVYTGEWVYGSLIVDYNFPEGSSFRIVTNSGTYDWVSVIPETVGQYTGLNDRNGKDIYEGDILTYLGTNMSDMEVKFENGCFVGEGLFNAHPLKVYREAIDFISWEVTGNIHDNKEEQT